MILYLDASALVKRYLVEAGTTEVARAISDADVVGTSLISRAETAAALAKAVRVGALSRQAADSALQVFRREWPDLVRIQATDMLIARADSLAWNLNLRGCDAVHLASALLWQDSLGRRVTFATFDQKLWQAGEQQGLISFR
jgi:predicted nucleic acid-binding protein